VVIAIAEATAIEAEYSCGIEPMRGLRRNSLGDDEGLKAPSVDPVELERPSCFLVRGETTSSEIVPFFDQEPLGLTTVSFVPSV